MSNHIQERPVAGILQRHQVIRTWRALLWFFDHWVLVFAVLLGVLNLLPFLAPVFMRWNWTVPANLIYALYSPLCHQMAQRSFFLFGAQPMYNIAELPLPDGNLADMNALRAFVGSSELGWKVAWSDRMVYMYGGLWLAGAAFAVLRRRRTIKPLSLAGFGLLLLPMMVDGGTHLISDIAGGLTGGFRYENQWLADLTSHALPPWFYVGDAFGSFNSWMRLISGLTFGVAVVWLAYPYLNGAMVDSARALRAKLQRAGHS
ncbi:MAG: DUF2085 domain-containing protein [Anaerolineae bacterium]|nr:DUF2085 domain-containing protein [Anaerolineae bacterium]